MKFVSDRNVRIRGENPVLVGDAAFAALTFEITLRLGEGVGNGRPGRRIEDFFQVLMSVEINHFVENHLFRRYDVRAEKSSKVSTISLRSFSNFDSVGVLAAI